jgi:hypothetical protein
MSLHETLYEELKLLRKGTGLNEARLSQQATLVRHLEGPDKLHTLINLVGQVGDQEGQTAIRYAFGLEGGEGNRLTKERRKAATEVLRTSLTTLMRRELDGLDELARIVIKQSPSLTENQREEEVNATATADDRINSLERLVAIMARRVFASTEADEYYKKEFDKTAPDEWEEFFELAHHLDVKTGGPGFLIPPKDDALLPDE